MGVFSDYFSDARFIYYEFLKFLEFLKCFSDFTNFFSENYLLVFKSGPLICSNQSQLLVLNLFKGQRATRPTSFLLFPSSSPISLSLLRSLQRRRHCVVHRRLQPPSGGDRDMQDHHRGPLDPLSIMVPTTRPIRVETANRVRPSRRRAVDSSQPSALRPPVRPSPVS